MVSPDLGLSASAFASDSSSCTRSASRVSGSFSRTVLSVLPVYARAVVSLYPIAVCAPTISLALPP